MKVDKEVFIYKRIQTINKVDEECECFRQAIYKQKKFFNRIQFNQYSVENKVFFYQKQL